MTARLPQSEPEACILKEGKRSYESREFATLYILYLSEKTSFETKSQKDRIAQDQ